MGLDWFAFAGGRLPELWMRTGEHLVLTGVSTGIAILLGVPLGILAARVPRLRGPVTGTAGILQTIPSLALLAFLLAMLGRIGTLPAVVALILYALLPIIRNTLAGLEGVSPEVVEAAHGIGMTSWQRLWLAEMPLALPVVVAGIRTAAVVCVGIATLSAFIGAGGLGQFINRGLALSSTDLILLGAIPAALLALAVDGSIAAAQWGLQPRRGGAADTGFLRGTMPRMAAVALPLVVVGGGSALCFAPGADPATAGQDTIAVGSKNFTEQLILGELMAQLIEAHTDLRVERRFNLGGTMICHGALTGGSIDLYAEYTGTGLTAILKQPVVSEPREALENVRRAYAEQFDAAWLAPFGFNNTYAITVRADDARQHSLDTISSLQPQAETLRAGFTAEFAERPDGYPGLREQYGFAFAQVRDLDPSLMYQAIANEEVDVICAFATDGRIAAFDLIPLRDNQGFFPPYQAAPVVRADALAAHPSLQVVLEKLGGALDDATMQRLNYAVDGEGKSPAAVAAAFLRMRKLLPNA